MVNALLKNGTPVEFTLTGLSASVTKIDNNSVVFENEKGETIVSTLSDVESMLKAGTLKVQVLLCGVPVGYIRGLAGTTTNLLLRLGLIKAQRRGEFGLIETGSH